MTAYPAFLASKTYAAPSDGIDVPLDQINPLLYPFQRRLVQWALRKGRAAFFWDCGLGKTAAQLEWANQIYWRITHITPPTILLITPLAVAEQTLQEAAKFNIQTPIHIVKSGDEVDRGINITNYERLHLFEGITFDAVILDESSILKSYNAKTKTRLIEMFRDVPYKLCCTATPAPNDVAELANHAEFLGIMTRQEMLSEYFVHDEEWRLKKHGRRAFYAWLASWGMFVRLPSDVGHEDDGYILPPLTVTPEIVDGNATAVAQAQGKLFFVGLKGIQDRAAARKSTILQRVSRACDIIEQTGGQWVVWCDRNDEQDAITEALSISDVSAVSVYGSLPIAEKEHRVRRWLSGEVRVLVTKPSICGMGLNLQQCHNVMFLGLSDSYESYYQAIRRCWRFGQESPVDVRIVISDLEVPIMENVQGKEMVAQETAASVVDQISDFSKIELGMKQMESNEYVEAMHSGGQEVPYTIMMGDSVQLMQRVLSESMGFSIFSPPFLSLFVYSNSDRDMGNCRSEEEYLEHFNHLLPEMFRVMKTGRIVAIHVAQVASTLVHDGFIGLKDFRGMIIQAMIDNGFNYHGDITVDKNPQAQAVRIHAKGLAFQQLKKDASWLRPGLVDYLLIFRKPGEPTEKIHPDINNDEWIKWAHGVWYDIKESDTLNTREGRANDDERHVCPLQLGLIERAIRLWSNKGDTVLDPFAGIGSTGYAAIPLERKFVGIELKPEYYETAKKNLERAIAKRNQGRLL